MLYRALVQRIHHMWGGFFPKEPMECTYNSLMVIPASRALLSRHSVMFFD